jgi:cell division protein FtsZ
MEGAFELVDTYNTKVVSKIISMSNSSDDVVHNLEKQIDGVAYIYSNVIENAENFTDIFSNSNMVFLIGLDDVKAKEIAEISIKSDSLFVSLVMIPLQFEIGKIVQLICNIDEDKTTNDILLESIKGIINSITSPNIIGIDFNDIKTIMTCGKTALTNTGFAMGEHRIRDATLQAMNSPLFLNINLKTVLGIFVTIATSDTSPMGIGELLEVNDLISELVSEDAIIKTGVFTAPDLDDYIRVTIVVSF